MSAATSAPLPVLALIGLRCTGKTSLGRRLAEGFGVPFVDLDEALCARARAAMHKALRLAARGCGSDAIRGVFRQTHDFERASAFFQTPEKAALFQRSDQAVNSRFRFEIKRVLHLIEGGRNTGLADPLVDEHQKLVLLIRQHRTPKGK